MLKLKQKWFSFWISLAFALRLRGASILLQRWLKKEHKAKRAELLRAANPADIRQYALDHKYTWRKDATRVGGIMIPLDWVSEPEVFQARLEDAHPSDGDCDDYHFWFASCLKLIPSVDEVLLVSVGYPGGGHTVCAYRQGEQKYLVNYGIQPIDSFDAIPSVIARWGVDDGKEPDVLWYAFESMKEPFTALAVGPKTLGK